MGIVAFVFAAMVAVLLADAVLVIGDRASGHLPDSLAVRNALAAIATGAVLVVAGALLVGVAFASAARFRTSPYVSIAVASVLSGIAMYPFFILMTVVNSCGLGTHWPYAWANACE